MALRADSELVGALPELSSSTRVASGGEMNVDKLSASFCVRHGVLRQQQQQQQQHVQTAIDLPENPASFTHRLSSYVDQ